MTKPGIFRAKSGSPATVSHPSVDTKMVQTNVIKNNFLFSIKHSNFNELGKHC